MDDEFVFTMDSPVDPNYSFLIELFEVYCGQGGEIMKSKNISSTIRSGWYA